MYIHLLQTVADILNLNTPSDDIALAHEALHGDSAVIDIVRQLRELEIELVTGGTAANS